MDKVRFLGEKLGYELPLDLFIFVDTVMQLNETYP